MENNDNKRRKRVLLFYEINDIPCYLVRSIHSNSTEWYENSGEIEGFQHEEGYEVTAVI